MISQALGWVKVVFEEAKRPKKQVKWNVEKSWKENQQQAFQIKSVTLNIYRKKRCYVNLTIF